MSSEEQTKRWLEQASSLCSKRGKDGFAALQELAKVMKINLNKTVVRNRKNVQKNETVPKTHIDLCQEMKQTLTDLIINLEEEIDVPKDMIDSVSKELLLDPVAVITTDSEGHHMTTYYNRVTVIGLIKHSRGREVEDPTNRRKLMMMDGRTVFMAEAPLIRNLVIGWLQEHGQEYNDEDENDEEYKQPLDERKERERKEQEEKEMIDDILDPRERAEAIRLQQQADRLQPRRMEFDNNLPLAQPEANVDEPDMISEEDGVFIRLARTELGNIVREIDPTSLERDDDFRGIAEQMFYVSRGRRGDNMSMAGLQTVLNSARIILLFKLLDNENIDVLYCENEAEAFDIMNDIKEEPLRNPNINSFIGRNVTGRFDITMSIYTFGNNDADEADESEPSEIVGLDSSQPEDDFRHDLQLFFRQLKNLIEAGKLDGRRQSRINVDALRDVFYRQSGLEDDDDDDDNQQVEQEQRATLMRMTQIIDEFVIRNDEFQRIVAEMKDIAENEEGKDSYSVDTLQTVLSSASLVILIKVLQHGNVKVVRCDDGLHGLNQRRLIRPGFNSIVTYSKVFGNGVDTAPGVDVTLFTRDSELIKISRELSGEELITKIEEFFTILAQQDGLAKVYAVRPINVARIKETYFDIDLEVEEEDGEEKAEANVQVNDEAKQIETSKNTILRQIALIRSTFPLQVGMSNREVSNALDGFSRIVNNPEVSLVRCGIISNAVKTIFIIKSLEAHNILVRKANNNLEASRVFMRIVNQVEVNAFVSYKFIDDYATKMFIYRLEHPRIDVSPMSHLFDEQLQVFWTHLEDLDRSETLAVEDIHRRSDLQAAKAEFERF